MTAPSLFDFDFSQPTAAQPLEPGDVVRQRGSGVGKFRTVFPYWQVLGTHPDSTPLRTLLRCRAVPVSAYPGQVAVFTPSQLEPTGLRWRVPGDAEVERWMTDTWGFGGFVAALNWQSDGTHFYYRAHWESGGARGEVVRDHPKIGGGVFVRLPTLPAEAPLLELMRDLPWACGATTR